ncbi:lysozyme [Rhizobium favelukesii]|uniref:Lysozyme n=1 Tax=Rhizobium favelukesii TaxID=348824 RepID=W6RF86_9HYPH|nr:lysozyme [Rhizobium favelukesii]MCS0463498.1 lysozyme [Rhizobium favelukesii]CDM59917.1 phage-related endolysin [Rhizobium favelukesii]
MKTRLKAAGGGLAALTLAGSMAIQTVGGFEGLRLYAYRDVVGIWTACYGATKDIKPGMKFSKATCDNMLVDSLIVHEQGMRACLKAPDALPIETYVAGLSLTYNVGVGTFCRSTAAHKLNAGDIRGACDSLTMFNKAGGRVVGGLVKRRAQEKALCLKAVA